MRLDVHGGGVVDAKAYKGWPGVVFNSKAQYGPAPWRGERYAIVFYNGCNSLLMSYWPMAFVLRATSEHRILPVYGRIPPSIRLYTWKYTAVYSKYTAKDLCSIVHAVRLLHAPVRTVSLGNWPTYAWHISPQQLL